MGLTAILSHVITCQCSERCGRNCFKEARLILVVVSHHGHWPYYLSACDEAESQDSRTPWDRVAHLMVPRKQEVRKMLEISFQIMFLVAHMLQLSSAICFFTTSNYITILIHPWINLLRGQSLPDLNAYQSQLATQPVNVLQWPSLNFVLHSGPSTAFQCYYRVIKPSVD